VRGEHDLERWQSAKRLGTRKTLDRFRKSFLSMHKHLARFLRNRD
jgi:hypothetical protein